MSNDDSAPKARTRSQYMSVQEAAQILGLSQMTIYRLLNDGTLPYLKVGRSKKIPRGQFEEWRRANTVQGTGLIEE